MLSGCKRSISLCSKECCKQCLSLLSVLFLGISVLVVMVSVSLLYIFLVNYGLNTASAGGFLLSFVPPVAIPLLGVYLNKDHFHKFLFGRESARHDEQDTSAEATETKDILQEKESHTSCYGSVDTIQKRNPNDSFMAPTQQQAGLAARSSSVVEPLLNKSQP